MSQSRSSSRRSRLGRIALVSASLALIGGVFVACGKAPIAGRQTPASHPNSAQLTNATAPSSQVNLTIVAQKPGGAMSGPAYMPTTNLTLPAHSVVSITIVNADGGDTALPAGSPFAQVTGVSGNHATVDGVAYSSLAPDKVAHTFTVPGLGVNVPIPGDAPAGKNAITVTFSFTTGGAGSYMWQCMDPCGSDPNGWGGPMASMGYMMGMVTVVG